MKLEEVRKELDQIDQEMKDLFIKRMEIAKKIHAGLETYHIPASVRKKTGKKMRMMPVYANRENKTISFGQTILYNPENGFGKEQVRIVTETRAQILEMAGYPQEAAALREETETKTGEAEE